MIYKRRISSSSFRANLLSLDTNGANEFAFIILFVLIYQATLTLVSLNILLNIDKFIVWITGS